MQAAPIHQNPKAQPKIHWAALGAVILATGIWGYSNVLIRQSEFAIPPALILWIRFFLAALVLLPWWLTKRLPAKKVWIGLGIGAVIGLGVLLQAWGMQTVSVDQVAFITALYVILTPIGIGVLGRRAPAWPIWPAALVSLTGLWLLQGGVNFHLASGSWLSLGAAFGFTGQIIGTMMLSREMPAMGLAGLQSLGAAVVLTPFVLVHPLQEAHQLVLGGMILWGHLVFLAMAGAVIAFWLQIWGQARINATQAALTFNMEPAWTALFSWLVINQSLTAAGIGGALLILLSLGWVSRLGDSG